MMARFIGEGVQDAIAELDEMSGRMLDICKMAVYSGAHVEFDAVKQQISALDESAINQHGRAELLAGLSSSKIKVEGGGVSAAITMAGYFTDHTGRQVPRALIAHSLNKGTSTMQATHMIDKAVRNCRADVEKAMKERIEKEISLNGKR